MSLSPVQRIDPWRRNSITAGVHDRPAMFRDGRHAPSDDPSRYYSEWSTSGRQRLRCNKEYARCRTVSSNRLEDGVATITMERRQGKCDVEGDAGRSRRSLRAGRNAITPSSCCARHAKTSSRRLPTSTSSCLPPTTSRAVSTWLRSGAELALRVMSIPFRRFGVMEGHAFPMGTFLLLGCDVRIGANGPFRMGLMRLRSALRRPALQSSWPAAASTQPG